MDDAGFNFRARLLALAALLLGCGALLVVRLYSVQITEHPRFAALARDEHHQTIEVPARRGDILDRNENPLALTVMFATVSLAGAEVKDPIATAQKLAPFAQMSVDEIIQRVDRSNKQLVPLRTGVPAATAVQIEELRLPGVYLTSTPARHYPEGSLAARTLGFVGRDFHGLAGIESGQDEYLAGIPGSIDTERDTTGQEILLGRRMIEQPRDGADLVLTIDRFAQRTAERHLADAVAKNKASGGTIIVMEPATGALLAIATSPTYNLTDEQLFRPELEPLYRPAEVTDQYEPGSVLKVITMAAGLDAGVVRPDSVVLDNGSVSIDGATVRNWNLQGNGSITMTQVLIYSSNIGAQYVANKLGPQRFYNYIESFGFGRPTGVGLPGEAPGMVRSATSPGWTRIDLITNSFGQGIAVTPMQLVSAIAAIGNDGLMMKPKLVREIRGVEGTRAVSPEPVRQVISPETAQTLRSMLVAVLEQKALEPHRIPGYRLAGKTGTADVVADGGYRSGKTYASVIALAPAHNPRFAVLIRLDSPEGLYGGVVAVPVLRQLLPELFNYFRVAPTEPVGRAA